MRAPNRVVVGVLELAATRGCVNCDTLTLRLPIDFLVQSACPNCLIILTVSQLSGLRLSRREQSVDLEIRREIPDAPGNWDLAAEVSAVGSKPNSPKINVVAGIHELNSGKYSGVSGVFVVQRRVKLRGWGGYELCSERAEQTVNIRAREDQRWELTTRRPYRAV
ncbi:hypothetical protein B0H13DRAFT_1864722 [Mycena leptocephala]|nr:hypothetical protein B0H13DRAFT_1864722 [Mycena leptocephala]